MAVELATGYVSIVPSADGFGKALANEIEKSGGADAVDKSFDRSKVTAVGVAMGTLLAKGIEGIISKSVDLAKLIPDLGGQFHQATADIRVGTGETGADLAKLQGSFEAIYQRTPAGMEDVSAAVTTLHQRLSLTGPVLDDTALSVLRLTRMTGGDLKTNLKNITGLFNNWNIKTENIPDTLDKLLRVSQKTGISIEDLTSQASDSGATFRALGMSFDDSIALIGQLSKAGLDASSFTMKFNRSIAEAAKNGKPAGEALRQVFDQIKRAPTDTAAAGIAIENFGARGVTMAQQIREGKFAYQDLSKEIKSGDTINQAANDTAGWSGKLDILKHKLETELKPVADATFEALTNGATAVGKWFDDHKPDLEQKIKDLGESWKNLLHDFGQGPQADDKQSPLGQALDQQKTDGPISGLSQGILPSGQDPKENFLGGSSIVSQFFGGGDPVAAFKAGLDSIGSTFDGWKTSFTTTVDDFRRGLVGDRNPFEALADGWERVKGAFDFGSFKLGLQSVLDTINPFTNLVTSVFHGLGELASGLWTAFTSAFDGIGNSLGALWTDFTQVLGGLVDFVKGVFTGNWSQAWGGILNIVVGIFQGVKDTIGAIATEAWSLVKALLNVGIAAVNGFLETWNNLQIPAIHIDLGFGKSIDHDAISLPQIPKIPTLATGGVVDSPTLAMIGETAAATPEIVTPERLLRSVFAGELARQTAPAGGGDTFHIYNDEPRETAYEVQRKKRAAAFMATGVVQG